MKPPPKDISEVINGLIRDSGFEDADLGAWPSFLSVTAALNGIHVHNGTHSLSESGGEGSVYQDITGLQPGRTYTVAAWVSASPGTTAAAQIALYSSSASVPTFSPAIAVTPDWQLLTHRMAASDKGTLRLHLFRKSGSGTIYWDDLRVYLDH